MPSVDYCLFSTWLECIGRVLCPINSLSMKDYHGERKAKLRRDVVYDEDRPTNECCIFKAVINYSK